MKQKTRATFTVVFNHEPGQPPPYRVLSRAMLGALHAVREHGAKVVYTECK
jgi:hypothetical protein